MILDLRDCTTKRAVNKKLRFLEHDMKIIKEQMGRLFLELEKVKELKE